MFCWNKFICLITGGRSSRCQRQLKLTGKPPSNAAETMIARIAGDRREMSLDWVEQQICSELYSGEVRRNWFIAVIGLCCCEMFSGEAQKILDAITPDFGVIWSPPAQG